MSDSHLLHLRPFTWYVVRSKIFNNLLCKTARLNNFDGYDYPIDRQDLFSLNDMMTIHHSLHCLPWIVVFQMESLLRNNAINFEEANKSYLVVLQMVGDTHS